MSKNDEVEASEFKDHISDNLHKYIKPNDTLVQYLFTMEIEEATNDFSTALMALKECRSEKLWKLSHFYAQDWTWTDARNYFPELYKELTQYQSNATFGMIIKKACYGAHDMELARRDKEEAKRKLRGTIDNVRSGLTFLKDLDGRA